MAQCVNIIRGPIGDRETATSDLFGTLDDFAEERYKFLPIQAEPQNTVALLQKSLATRLIHRLEHRLRRSDCHRCCEFINYSSNIHQLFIKHSSIAIPQTFLGRLPQTFIKHSSINHQTFIKHLSNNHQIIINHSSNIHQTLIKHLSNIQQTFIKHSSIIHQSFIKHL